MDLFDIPYNRFQDIQKGDILLAEPFMHDDNFGRSAVLICEHSPEGTFGLILNKPSSYMIEELTTIFTDIDVYMGGPVEQNTLHFIHTIPTLDRCIPLKNGYYWGGNYEELTKLHLAGKVTRENCRFFVGYSGWGKKQLAGELERNSWIVARVNLDLVLETEAALMWKEILKQMGFPYKILANYPIDPSLN
jgi:putative transcriptional regulator